MELEFDNDVRRKLYKVLCNEADELLKEYDPCKIKDGICARGMSCCIGCKYLGDKGCTVSSLVCKLWLCDKVLQDVNKNIIPKLENIFKRADRYDLIMFRANEDDVIYGFVDGDEAEVQMPWGTIYFLDSSQDVKGLEGE